MIYAKYPRYAEEEIFFIVNGNKINRGKTLEQNKIKNNDVITLMLNKKKIQIKNIFKFEKYFINKNE